MKRELNILCLAAASAAAVTLTGCITHRYGDARIQKNSDALSITADQFYLKPVPLGQIGVHVLEARGLPLPLFPSHLLVPITPNEAELKQEFPWARARLRIEFRALDGTIFFSKEIALADARPGHSPGTSHELDVPFRTSNAQPWKAPEDMPHYTSYDVIVTVLEPSSNAIHRATLYGDTYVR